MGPSKQLNFYYKVVEISFTWRHKVEEIQQTGATWPTYLRSRELFLLQYENGLGQIRERQAATV